MARFDFSLIPEDKRPKPKEPPTKEERKQAILETIEKLKECETKLRSIVTDSDDDAFIRININVIQNSIETFDFTLKRAERADRIEEMKSRLGR